MSLKRIAPGRHRRLSLLGLGAALLSAGAGVAQVPRPLSAVERRAVSLAVQYCHRGATAWWEALAIDSPYRALGREEALAEIEVRVGSACEGIWELQTVSPEAVDRLAVFAVEYPSGLDDVLVLEMDSADPPRLGRLRILAESYPESAALGAAVASVEDGRRWLVATSLAIGAMFAMSVVWGRSRRLLLVPAMLAAASTSCGDGGGHVDREPLRPAPAEGTSFLRLAGLGDVRWQLATRIDAAPLSPSPAEAETAAVEVAKLWRAQYALLREGAEAAAVYLEPFPDLGASPLLHLLRGRLAFVRSDEVEAALGYERAMERLPRFDGLLGEAAEVAALLGFEDRANDYLQMLSDLGTRRAAVYYELARRDLLARHEGRAQELFRVAFELEPLAREQLFEAPVLSRLLEPDIGVYHLLRLDQPRETVLRHPSTSTDPLVLPDGVRARLKGGTLRIDVGSGTILVPGGASLAPADTPLEAADAWEREAKEAVLQRLAELGSVVRRPGALAQGQVRRQVSTAVEALASHNRWLDLVELTDPLEDQVANIGAQVLRLRARALRKLGRRQAAIRLLAEVARHSQKTQRLDPVTLLELSDMLGKDGHFDAAIRLAAQANAQLAIPIADIHIDRLRMEKSLAAEFETTGSEHFEIRHPSGRGELARRMSRVLEAERARLLRWIPLSGDSTIEVHLLSFGDFANRYAGGVEVVGIFDGRIRLPLADIPWFPPIVVSIMTHELAHAMIAEYTRNQAPKWLHEGLAQHVEMVASRVNPIQDYLASGQFLSFPAVEGVLQGFPNERLVATAYDEAAWVLHYVEAEHGQRAVHRLLDGYREGLTTDAVLRAALSLSSEQLDRELRRWWLGAAPPVWETDVHEYERSHRDRLVRRSSDLDPDLLSLKWWQRD